MRLLSGIKTFRLLTPSASSEGPVYSVDWVIGDVMKFQKGPHRSRLNSAVAWRSEASYRCHHMGCLVLTIFSPIFTHWRRRSLRNCCHASFGIFNRVSTLALQRPPAWYENSAVITNARDTKMLALTEFSLVTPRDHCSQLCRAVDFDELN